MKKIIVTVGPSLMNDHLLKTIHQDNYIYRINGAHGTVGSIKKCIAYIRKRIPDAALLIDLPGNKIRITRITKPLVLKKGKTFTIPSRALNYPRFYECIKPGNRGFANDSTLSFIVKKVDKKTITFLSESNGKLLKNKGIHIRGACTALPFLFEKDRKLIELINECRVSYVGLSFVRTAEDIKEAQKLLSRTVTIISKIETQSAVDTIESILHTVDHVLLDRGDLSTDVGLEKVPAYQKYIIEKTLYWNKKIFIATQLLKNMVEKPIPSIAEVIDLFNTLKAGVYGIQLSEETAVGKFPVETLHVVSQMMHEAK